jgi:hypothetical protein
MSAKEKKEEPKPIEEEKINFKPKGGVPEIII